jgi:hypothetical protein
MKPLPRRLALAALILLAGLLLVLGLAANSWLESAAGRRVLQKTLTGNLGVPVELGGSYRLSFIPRLRITGTDLRVGQAGGPGLAAYSQSYAVTVELAPLLRREVKISSIALRDGFLAFDNTAGDTAHSARSEQTQIQLPRVDLLEISAFRLRAGTDQDRVLVKQLRISHFEAGQPTPLELQAALLTGEAETAAVTLQAEVTIDSDLLAARLDVSALELRRGQTVLSGLSGTWQWRQQAARLQGQMYWQHATGSAELQLEMALAALPSGTLQLAYRRPDAAENTASLAVDFAALPGKLVLDPLHAAVAGQSIGGSGCLLLSPAAALQLSLQAEDLDLDRIVTLLPPLEGEGSQWPIELAVRLHVAKAWLSGATARDVDVAIGEDPDCGPLHTPGT